MSRSVGELVVVGGGPVGLAASIGAALAGMDVTVVEPRTPPVDKACGEGLMPGAVAALARLGVQPPGHDFAGISYLGADGRSGGRHAFRSGPGLGVRRTALHTALHARATQLGVRVVVDRVVALSQDGERVRVGLSSGGSLDARWAFGCDGLRSRTRALVGITSSTNGRRFGLRRHARLAPWSRDVEVHWSAVGEAYVTPVADDQVGVALLTTRGTDFETTLAAFPGLRCRLHAAHWVDDVRGAGPLQRRVSQRTSGRVLLVGDAAGYVDALTGEGLRVGLACAAAAVTAVRAGDAASYERRWLDLTRGYRCLTGALVTTTRLDVARAAIVPASARLPAVFGRAVEVLAG